MTHRMGRQRSRPALNTDDPLANKECGERCVAACFAIKMNKTQITVATGKTFNTVNNWERGAMPEPETIGTIARLTDYTMEELVYGHQELTGDQVAAIADARNAPYEHRALLTQYLQSIAGQVAKSKLTRAWVNGFFDALLTRPVGVLAPDSARNAAVQAAELAAKDEARARKRGARKLKPRSTPPSPDSEPPTQRRRR